VPRIIGDSAFAFANVARQILAAYLRLAAAKACRNLARMRGAHVSPRGGFASDNHPSVTIATQSSPQLQRRRQKIKQAISSSFSTAVRRQKERSS
jgi:hypothetical protein